jgi:hypothetical protein
LLVLLFFYQQNNKAKSIFYLKYSASRLCGRKQQNSLYGQQTILKDKANIFKEYYKQKIAEGKKQNGSN